MKDDQIQDCEAFQAALPEALLGALETDQALRVIEHVTTCVQCHSALRKSVEVVSQAVLSDADLEAPVPTTLKRRVMQSIRGISQFTAGVKMERNGTLIVRAPEVPWQEIGLPGVQQKPFSSVHTADRTMSLFRMDAGSVFPEHSHESTEELYVLSGTLLVEGVAMYPGDYCRAEFGSMHMPVIAVTNTEFLVCMGSSTGQSH